VHWIVNACLDYAIVCEKNSHYNVNYAASLLRDYNNLKNMKYIDYTQFFVSLILPLPIWFLKKAYSLLFLSNLIFRILNLCFYAILLLSSCNLNALTKTAHKKVGCKLDEGIIFLDERSSFNTRNRGRKKFPRVQNKILTKIFHVFIHTYILRM